MFDILSEKTEIFSYYDIVMMTMVSVLLIYVVVNKLSMYQRMVPLCVLPPVMPQTLANH